MRRYEVKWKDEALESLSKLDETTERKIKNQTENSLNKDPFWNGKPMWGRWKGFWTYRIDDYRAIYEIVYEVKEKEKEIVVAVVKVEHRSTVYEGELPTSTSDYKIIERPKARDLKRKVVGNRGKKKLGIK